MAQRLHLVFGGELTSPEKNVFRDISKIHSVGMFPDCQSAHLAWKAEALRTVDNALKPYVTANIHRLRDEARPGCETEPMTT